MSPPDGDAAVVGQASREATILSFQRGPAIVGPPSASDIGEINSAHELAVQARRSALQHAVECGRLLLAAKEKLAHGAWLMWVGENLEFYARSAAGYMKIAGLPASEQQRVAGLPLRRALGALAKPGRERAPKPKATTEENELTALLEAWGAARVSVRSEFISQIIDEYDQ